MTQLQFRWNPAERGRDRGQSKNQADLSLQRLSVSLTGSTGYLENRLYTDTLTHGGTLFTLHTAPSDTHPLNGWSLVVIWQTHTNTHITHAHRLTHTGTQDPRSNFSASAGTKCQRGLFSKSRAVLVGVLYHVLCDVCQNVQPFDTGWGKHTHREATVQPLNVCF